ncbi:MAG: hypothetical protein GY862_22965 [Gammaproteobacteria bacterium]|nr:hypothetical protein [Gammaproteobacteria bacterium]
MTESRAVFITALGLEYLAVKKYLSEPKEEEYKGALYEIGEYRTPDNVCWRIALVQTGAGTKPAAIHTERAISYFDPSHIFFAGVAGGISKEVKLGDVVASSKVYGYESGKADEKGFHARPDAALPSHDMEQRAMSIVRNEQWPQKLSNPPQPPPNAYVAPIAAGEKVLADSRGPICQFIRKHYNDALAVEMEGAGFLSAAHAHTGIQAMVVRGISDLLDDKEQADKKKWQPKAAAHAAAFAFAMLDKINQNSVKKPLDEQTPEKTKTYARADDLKVFLSKLPISGPDLFGREAELALLDEAWRDPAIHIVTLAAWGGVGKSALVNHWLNRMATEHFRGAARAYAWSFYSQGTEGLQASADIFFKHALEWFGDPEPQKGSAWDKGARLADLVRQQSALLILDGLEPLQHPPGEMEGRLKDPCLQALLRELGRYQPGLCVITTRTPVTDLKDMLKTSLQRIFLDHLSPEAGTRLLENTGVRGTEAELRKTSLEFGGHALALNLLGNYLAVAHEGEIRKRDLIPRLSADEKAGGHARRVMESYEHWLQQTTPPKKFLGIFKRPARSAPELNILNIMGLFDRPAPKAAIEAVRVTPVIPGLTDGLQKLSKDQWAFALQHLRNLGLLAFAADGDFLDCHPLIREHFGDKLCRKNPAAWKKAHSRLYRFFKDSAKELPDTLEEMEPLFMAVGHGCRAGLHQEALDEVFWPRIQRKNEFFSTKKLGAFGADLAALAGFFEQPWERPAVGLMEEDKAVVLNRAGFRLRALGRLREATQPIRAGMEASVSQEDWKGAAQDAGNLSELWLTLGEVNRAVTHGRESVRFADRSGDDFQKESKRTTLADALHQAGELAQAEALFREAEAMQKERQPVYPFLYSLQGFQFCDLLLSQGQYREVLERAAQTLEWVTQQKWLLDIALDQLSLGRALVLQARAEKSGDYAKAMSYLDQAVAGLRQAGTQNHLPRGLLARAALYRELKESKKARADLAEAEEIAQRGGMELYLVDTGLERVRLELAEGKLKNTGKILAEVAEKIARTGYRRREAEVAMINVQCSMFNVQ